MDTTFYKYLKNNNINMYALEIINIKPKRVIYGIICNFCNNQ